MEEDNTKGIDKGTKKALAKKIRSKSDNHLGYLLIYCMEEGANEVLEEVLQEEEIALEHSTNKKSFLIVHNDDYNTFDHVIDTLISVCSHSRQQAEQCAHLIHYNGKCCVKEGPYSKIASMCKRITDAGMQAEIA